jgi:hypothetical protein
VRPLRGEGTGHELAAEKQRVAGISAASCSVNAYAPWTWPSSCSAEIQSILCHVDSPS